MPCMQAEELLQICPPKGSQTGEVDTTGCHEASYFICIGCDSSAAVCSPWIEKLCWQTAEGGYQS